MVILAVYIDEKIEFLEKQRRDKSYKMAVAHFHKRHELYYLVEGQTRYFVGNEIFLLEAGDMIFVPKGEFHKTVYEESTSTERVLFGFDDNFVNGKFDKYIEEMTKNKYITFPKDKAHKIKDIVEKCIKESENKPKGYEDMKNLLLGELLVTISRYRKTETAHISPAYTAMQDIAKHISSHYNSDLSLQALAKQFSISPNHLSKQFKKVTGVSLSEYINIARIGAAEKFLAQGNLPVTRVATECGFNDSNYFAAVFKKLKGITPKKYSMTK